MQRYLKVHSSEVQTNGNCTITLQGDEFCDEGGKRKRKWQRTRGLDSITVPVDMSLSKLQEIEKVREAWCAAVHRVTKCQIRLSD